MFFLRVGLGMGPRPGHLGMGPRPLAQKGIYFLYWSLLPVSISDIQLQLQSQLQLQPQLEAQGSNLKASVEKNTQRRILSIWEEIEERFLYLDTDTPSLYLFPNRETFLLSVFAYLGYC